MCIRDSYIFDSWDGYWVGGADRIIVQANGVTKFDESFSNCLLYTSDAADERSSVDLGGRRIIKKKKNQRVHEHNKIHKQAKHTHMP